MFAETAHQGTLAHPPVPDEAVEAVTAELIPDDGRRKIRDWPVPYQSAPTFVAIYLAAPRFRQEVLRDQAVAQACRDAADMPAAPQLTAGETG